MTEGAQIKGVGALLAETRRYVAARLQARCAACPVGQPPMLRVLCLATAWPLRAVLGSVVLGSGSPPSGFQVCSACPSQAAACAAGAWPLSRQCQWSLSAGFVCSVHWQG